ncbi:hypothetical protein AVEN_29957-1 [Araneus ventricosus]|uniref:Uncharacterized protein n=1 Tax=Araneus ventricosus TaxID=182803 RepID=A0A4Y2GWJ8_ARAVE|nr:hypothetical protein AVEN_29957-1 [Araneus ventricosus]
MPVDQDTPSSQSSPDIVYRMESSSTFKRIFSPNGNIEKIPAPLRSHISSPNFLPSGQDGCQVSRQGQGTRCGCASHPILIPVKLST